MLRLKSKKFGNYEYEIIDRGELAFDHAAIIASAYSLLKKNAKSFEVLFDFLPEKFTLTSLQTIQETILGESTPPANFRRKIADYVIETQEYQTGAGHRPARLYMRKDI